MRTRPRFLYSPLALLVLISAATLAWTAQPAPDYSLSADQIEALPVPLPKPGGAPGREAIGSFRGWCCRPGDLYPVESRDCVHQGGTFFLAFEQAERRCPARPGAMQLETPGGELSPEQRNFVTNAGRRLLFLLAERQGPRGFDESELAEAFHRSGVSEAAGLLAMRAGEAGPELLQIPEVMALTAGDLEGELRGIAAKVAENNEKIKALRSSIAELRDILLNWPPTQQACRNMSFVVLGKDGELLEYSKCMGREEAQALLEKLEEDLERLGDNQEQGGLSLDEAIRAYHRVSETMINILEIHRETAGSLVKKPE